MGLTDKEKLYISNESNTVITLIKEFKNIAKFTILIALAGIPLVFLPLGKEFDHFYLPKVVAMFILVFSFLSLFILNFKNVGKIIENDWIDKSLLIYFFLLIISVFFADNFYLAIFGSVDRLEGIITISMYMILFLIARYCSKTNDKFYLIILLTAILVSIYGIFQHFGLDPFIRDAIRTNWGYRSFSTMGNPNFLGTYLVLMIPISIYFFIIRKLKTGLLFYSILLYCLLCTSTRGSWLGSIASMVSFSSLHYYFYKIKKDELNRYIILLFLSIIIVLLYDFQTQGELLNRFLSITNDARILLTNGENSDYTGAHRGFIWKRVVELIKNRPIFGYGIENLGITFEKYYQKDMIGLWGNVINVDRAHNEYLHIAVSSGIPSLIAYLTFLTLILKNGLCKIRHDKYMLLLISSIIGYLVAAFFNISVVSVVYVYWIFLGLIATKVIN
ncbi:putative inorganic carbon (HCO3(-)) transporter [Sedimentibacter acidaminivorans]|uniref:Inorganic carbon (HCO3(-)) transporter n=1 Tax=Sedimentibacter acidaminivorans TaxID=913099 RepID=A0ABS4GAU3_9FIRM|nr:O-antigen ligase family protein [Sedimentibacter acidaminivorans]MBP1924803.1 putative inorganic carbon (HCO3(-)) transporter [Sedimentibacter acidaminivorans]